MAAVTAAARPLHWAEGYLAPETYMFAEGTGAVEAAGEICTYSDSLAAMFRDLQSAPPDGRMMYVLKALAEDPTLILGLCGADGYQVFASMARVAREDASEFLVDGCKLDQLGLAPREVLTLADADRLIVAALVFTWMKSAEVPEKQAQRACRKILGR